MSERDFDVVILGAGPAGEVCAGRVAEAGLAVAIVERDLVGGECSYYACMPSKALLRPADLLAEARRVPGLPVAAGGPDGEAVLARRDEVVHDLDDGTQLPWLRERGIELIRGEGRLDGERRVTVGEETLIARLAVVIATGSGAAAPPIPGIDSVETWNNRQGTTATEVPASLVVLGGGPVGCELAQAWASLGSEVALLEPGERLLSHEEPFAGEQVAESLRSRFGVDVRTGVGATRVRTGDQGAVVELEDGGELSGERLLLATGRVPHTAAIGLESVGVEPNEHGFLDTDDRLRVGERDWLYAIGDVNGRALLTHMGKYQAWVAAENLLGREQRAGAEALGSPRVTFTDPQVAAAGRTAAQARADGLDVLTVEVPTDATAGASFQGKGTGGTSHLVVDRRQETILGATFTGFETAELLQAATVAIVAEVPLPQLRHAIPPFPTRNEIWLKLVERYEAER